MIDYLPFANLFEEDPFTYAGVAFCVTAMFIVACFQYVGYLDYDYDDGTRETYVVMGVLPETEPKCHVTFAFKADCSDREQFKLTMDGLKTISSRLPLRCRVGDRIRVGKTNDLVAREILIENMAAHLALDAFWHRHQRRAEGERMFDFNPHTTLSNDEKRTAVEALAAKGSFYITDVIVRRLSDKKIVQHSFRSGIE